MNVASDGSGDAHGNKARGGTWLTADKALDKLVAVLLWRTGKRNSVRSRNHRLTCDHVDFSADASPTKSTRQT